MVNIFFSFRYLRLVNIVAVKKNRKRLEDIFVEPIFSVSRMLDEKLFEGSKAESFEVNSISLVDDEIFIASNDGLWQCDCRYRCR